MRTSARSARGWTATFGAAALIAPVVLGCRDTALPVLAPPDPPRLAAAGTAAGDAAPDASGAASGFGYGREGTPITFSVYPYALYRYLWDFGDGATSTLYNTTHAYADNGTYHSTLTVTDPAGAATQFATTYLIANVAPTVAFRATSATSFEADGTLSVQGSFTDPGTVDAPWRFVIDWGDGTAATTGTLLAQGSAISRSHVYTRRGTYGAVLRVTDKDGATGTSARVAVAVSGWESLGGTVGPASTPVSISRSTGRLDAFARGADDVLWHRSFDGAAWSAWTSLGWGVVSDPAVASWEPGRLDVFVRGTDQALWHRVYLGGAWGPWESLGGAMLGAPAVASWGPNRLDVFVRGVDNALYHKAWDGAAWSGWEPLGGGLTSDPVVVSWGAGRLDVFVRGTDSALWHLAFGGSWSTWEPLGGGLLGNPAAVSWGPGRLDVFVRGMDNALWTRAYDYGGWWGWVSLGGGVSATPAVESWGPGRLDVVVRGTDNALWHRFFQGSWSAWYGRGGPLTSAPSLVSSAAGRLDVFARGPDGTLWHR